MNEALIATLSRDEIETSYELFSRDQLMLTVKNLLSGDSDTVEMIDLHRSLEDLDDELDDIKDKYNESQQDNRILESRICVLLTAGNGLASAAMKAINKRNKETIASACADYYLVSLELSK